MKVLGGIAILLAAFLGLGAYNSYANAKKLNAKLGKQGKVTNFVGEATGLNELDRMRVRALEDQGKNQAIAAGVVGFLGLVFCTAGSGRPPRQRSRDYYNDAFRLRGLSRNRWRAYDEYEE
jgi:hypothetical protein